MVVWVRVGCGYKLELVGFVDEFDRCRRWFLVFIFGNKVDGRIVVYLFRFFVGMKMMFFLGWYNFFRF